MPSSWKQLQNGDEYIYRIHSPNTTPAYSNFAFAMLGLILESATGAPYADTLRRLLVDPLGVKDTTASAPRNSSRGVIVGSETAVGWEIIFDDA
jgi:CubicO group peptidase (beta-lactamase class C family)